MNPKNKRFTVASPSFGTVLLLILFFVVPVQLFSLTKTDSLKQVLKQDLSEKERLETLVELSGFLIVNNELEEANSYLRQAKSIAQHTQNKLNLIKIYNLQGIIKMSQNKYSEARDIFSKALLLTREIKEPKEEGNILSNLGLICFELGDYKQAINYHLEAYKIRVEIKDELGVSKSETSIGNVYFVQKNYEKALKYYKNAVKMNQKLQNPLQIGILQNNIGLIHLAQKKYKLALDFFEMAYQTTTKINDIEGQADAFIGMGEVYFFEKNYEKALEYIHKSLRIYEQLDYKKRMAECYQMLGSLSLEINQTEKAFQYFNKQIALAKEIGNKENIRSGYKSLSDYYKSKKKYKQAYDYYVLYVNIKDSLLNEANSKNLAEQEIKFQSEKKQKENEVLEQKNKFLFQKNKTQQLKISKNRYFIIGLISVVVFVSIIAFMVIKYNRTKTKNEKIEIEQKLLRSQMNPHFIFNAMVGIQNYIYKEEPEIAANYLSSIVYLMRSIIENSHKEKVSLEKEIETLRHYLNLQRVRYDQKFDFCIEIAPEVEEESLFIPPMMAQPIIENAVEHGIMNKEDGEGFIRIKIGLETSGFLTLTIEDNGIGRDKAKELKKQSGAHLSIATAITEERLAVINRKAKKKASMQIEDLKNENGQALGTRVLFHFPVNQY